MKRSRFVTSSAMVAASYQALGVDSEGVRTALGKFRVLPRPAVVVVETRQQRRHKERMAGKADLAKLAAKVWDGVTGGDGVVLKDGEPVEVSKALS